MLVPTFTFYLIADFHTIIYFTVTFPPLIILENEIYNKTINYVISVKLHMIGSTVSVYSSVSLQPPWVRSAVARAASIN